MCRLLSWMLAAVGMAVLPQLLLADEAEGPAQPRSETFFKRLDANQDGQITADEIPARLPEHFKAMLKRADKNADQKITADEFAASVKQLHAGPPAFGTRRPGPPRPPFGGPPRGPMPGRFGRPGRGALPLMGAGPGPRVPDPKILFARLDRDKDGKLSPEEFTAGMRLFHRPGGPLAVPGHRPFPGYWLGHPGAPVAQRLGLLAAGIFKKADADPDGKVTLDEVPADRQERFKRLLARADKDGDKALSAEEARRAAAAVMMRARFAMARKAAAGQRAAAFKRAAEARKKAVAARKRAEAQKKGAAAKKAAPSAEKPAKAKTTPEARKKAAAAKNAAQQKRAEARKKAAEAKKKAAPAKKAAAQE